MLFKPHTQHQPPNWKTIMAWKACPVRSQLLLWNGNVVRISRWSVRMLFASFSSALNLSFHGIIDTLELNVSSLLFDCHLQLQSSQWEIIYGSPTLILHICQPIQIHLWQYCHVISVYLLSSVSHFKPLTACTLVHSPLPWVRLDVSRLDPVLLWCQMIVSDRVYRCDATQVAHSSNYLQ